MPTAGCAQRLEASRTATSLPPPAVALCDRSFPLPGANKLSFGLLAGRAEELRSRFVGWVGVVDPTASLTASSSGQSVILSVGEAAAAGDDRLPAIPSRYSCARRDFPTPARPSTVKVARAIAHRLFEGVVRSPALTLAADHRRRKPSGCTRPVTTARSRHPRSRLGERRVAQQLPLLSSNPRKYKYNAYQIRKGLSYYVQTNITL